MKGHQTMSLNRSHQGLRQHQRNPNQSLKLIQSRGRKTKGHQMKSPSPNHQGLHQGQPSRSPRSNLSRSRKMKGLQKSFQGQSRRKKGPWSHRSHQGWRQRRRDHQGGRKYGERE